MIKIGIIDTVCINKRMSDCCLTTH